MSADSHVTVDAQGRTTAFVGDDAVSFFRAHVIASALRLYAATGIRANRAYTPTAMLAAATGITGKKYKRGEYERAAADVTAWADVMKAALPVVRNEERR